MPVGRTPIIDLDNHLVDDLPSWGEWIEEEWRSLLPKKMPGTADERPRTQVGERVMIGSEIPNQRGKRPNWVGTSDHTPEGRVKLLDEAGIDMAVLSPSSSAQTFMWFPDNPKLAAAYCRAQNNYMADYASRFPDRLKWAGTIPVQDAEEAVKELRRIVPLGSVGVNLKAVPVNGREWYDPFYDRLFDWSLAQLGDNNLVLRTDTPHWDAAPPAEAIKPILQNQRLSSESKEKILGANAAKLLPLQVN